MKSSTVPIIYTSFLYTLVHILFLFRSNEAYYALGAGGLVFILLVVGCCCCCYCCCCRSKKSNEGQTMENVQQAMPSAPNTIALGE